MKNYNNAVTALASGIESTQRRLDTEERVSIAEEMLKHGPENHSNWNNIQLNLSQESIGNLREYHGNLQQAYSEEIGKGIKQTMEKVEKVTDLRERLHSELNRALDETRELEEIAERLQDSGIGNVAGKEERQVRELGKNLEKLDSKGEDLEKLENRLESLLDSHNLDKEDLHNELDRRASAINSILQTGDAGNNGDKSTTSSRDSQINQLAQQIIRDRGKLEKFEQKVGNDLQRDIEKLSKLTKHKKNEISGLSRVYSDLQEGNLPEAKSKLDGIEDDRENILGGESIEDVFDDIQEVKDISVAVRKFFEEIEEIDQQGKIQELETALASNNDISENKAEELVNLKHQRQKYEKLKEEISNVEELEKENLGLDQEEYQRVKKLFNQESHLADRINDPGYQQMFNSIHSELEQLGHEIEHDIQIEGGSTSSDSETGREDSDTGSHAKKGPAPNEDPWIVSISDVESWPQFLIDSLNMVNSEFKPIVNFDGDRATWAGNNYNLIINGDLIQHGRHGESQQTKRLIKILRNIVNSAENQTKDGNHPVRFTVGNHDPNLVFRNSGMFPKGDEIGAAEEMDFVETYREWVKSGIVNMAIPGHNYTYVHAGQAHEWTGSEITKANEILRNLNGTKTGGTPYPNLEKLKEIDIDDTEAHKLSKGTLIKTVQKLDVNTKVSLFDFEEDDFRKESDAKASYMVGTYKHGDLGDKLSKKDILNNLENVYQLGLSRVKFTNIPDDENKIAKILGVGEGTQGYNRFAGMTWARPSVVKHGPPQIVGHTGQRKPKRKENLIVENTTAKSGYLSVVIETSEKAFALVENREEKIEYVNL